MEQSRNYHPLIIVMLFAVGVGLYLCFQLSLNVEHTLRDRLGELQQRFEKQSPESAESSEEPSALTACEWTKVRRELRNCVVQVFSHRAEFNWLEPYRTPAQGQSCGSAFFINDQGELITNAHVVNQAKAVFIQIPSQGKRQFEVDVIGLSMDRDLALLKLKPYNVDTIQQALGKIPFLTFADSNSIMGSEEIMTLGYPLGQQSLKGTTGIVSGREHIGGQYMIQISAPINPGNSGGPSIDRCGHVVGVNTSGIMGSQNVNYIIPSNEVDLFIKQLRFMLNKQEVTKTPTLAENPLDALNNNAPEPEQPPLLVRKNPLGLIYAPSSDDLARLLGNPVPGGLYITDTCPNSLVQKAGLKPGDMIYNFNGHTVDIFGDMQVPWSDEKVGIIDLMSLMTYGDNITMKIYRKGTPHNLKFTYEQTPLAPIRQLYPGYEAIDYEMIGGLVIMPLSLNLLYILAPAVPELAWYIDVRNQTKPALVVTHLLPDSVAMRARTINVGAVITETNGKPTRSLEDFRTALQESVTTNLLTLKTKDKLFIVFPFDQIVREEEKLARNFCFSITDTVRELRKKAYERAQQALNKNQLTPAAVVKK